MKWYWWVLIGLIVGFIIGYFICRWKGGPGEKIWCETLQCYVEPDECPPGEIDGGDVEGSSIAIVRNNDVKQHASRSTIEEADSISFTFYYTDDNGMPHAATLGEENVIKLVFHNHPDTGPGRDRFEKVNKYAKFGYIVNEQPGKNKFKIELYGHKRGNPNTEKLVWQSPWIDIIE